MMPVEMSKENTLQWLYWIICISFISIVFLIDYVIPFGVAIGTLYIFPLFVAIFLMEDWRASIVLPLICSGLIFVNIYIVDGASLNWIETSNRVISLVVVIFGSIFTVLYKKSLKNLIVSEQKMSAALNGAPNGVLLVDINGYIVFANRQIEEIFGYSKNELLGKNVDILVPPEVKEVHKGFREKYLQEPVSRPMGLGRELFGVQKNGSRTPVEIGLTPIVTNHNLYIMSSIIDVTHRREQMAQINRMNSELIAKNVELVRSNKELDDFAYIASHDLKEPLRGIYNNARFLQEDYEELLGEDGKKRLERMRFLTSRLESLINDLLYYSRLGRQNLAIQKTDIALVIEDVKSILESTILEENVAIEVQSDLPKIICDQTRITEVFMNLFSNAIKYNNSREKRIEVGCLRKLNHQNINLKNVFFVRDNGQGIDKSHFKDVFRIFKRLNVEDESKKGTGVGLTFVRKIISRHGGQIWIESELGKGSTFYFYLNQEGSYESNTN